MCTARTDGKGDRARGPRRTGEDPVKTFVDRGGTFTDVVTLSDRGDIEVRKVPSDRAVVGELARGALTFGTTVATNALLEGQRVPTLLVVTEGFADLPRIRDMTRPELFDPDARWPDPLLDEVVEVTGRLRPDGEVVGPLGPLPAVDFAPAAVAIVLLHGPSRPAWEEQLAEAARRRWPEAHVALGHRLAPQRGYLARLETTLVDAAITPILRRAMARDAIPATATAIRSDGSLVPAEELNAPDAVLSGPAGGVVAVAAVARHLGVARMVGFDMGGTSTDVSLVVDGEIPRRDGHQRVAGTALRRPVLEVSTIASGGGSVLHHDGIRLRVGPRSAGADPGPQCYGRGGPPTVTDAALAAGRIDPAAFDPPLQPQRVDLPDRPEAYLAVAHEQMAGAIRALAAARGEDVRDAELVAFGGAAGQHAAEVAERLGIATVWMHPTASVFSAFGQALARREEVAVRALWKPLDTAWPEVEAAWAELQAELPELGEVDRSVDLRRVGTDTALTVRAGSAAEARRAFQEQHQRRLGVRAQGKLEVVDDSVRALAPAPTLPEVQLPTWGVDDQPVAGPIRLDAPTTSVWVPEGWQARRDRGLLRLDRLRPPPRPDRRDRTPEGTALWGHRLTAVATEAGAVLRRLARSVNVRDRLDFSCAVFDGDGQLVVNAPHVPVHLGAMGSTVRDLLARTDPELGQHYLSNDPAAGGSHLPDLTVVHPVWIDGHRLFVANRAHHVDVGGLAPGSMPPHSERLVDEGFVVRNLPLLVDGALREDLGDHLVGCRQLDVVVADLGAQIAANTTAARGLERLGPLVSTWARHLLDAGEDAMAALIDRLGASTATDELAGLPLSLALTADRQQGRLTVDLRGCGGPHPGNLNAPPAVVRAAVLYALRVITGADVPLNDGLLRRVDILTPRRSVVSPPPEAAVAGGNVETSQRVADLVLAAADRAAGSAGTMSNLTLGGQGWSIYETVGGGQGASAEGPGASARQLHMTNTRATDPEVLASRVPVSVRRFAVRTGSGGRGDHPGGDGIVRELEVHAPARASLLATRRRRGAPGAHGGGDGQPGADEVCRAGRWARWDGTTLELQPGDRVRVTTPGGGAWGNRELAED